MTTVNCPKCDEQVRLPAVASAQASVQCPLCLEEFELAEALDRLAPMLVVVRDPGSEDVAFAPAGPAYSGTDLLAESGAVAGDSVADAGDEDASAEAFGVAAAGVEVEDFLPEGVADTTSEYSVAETSVESSAAPAFSFEDGSANSGGGGSIAARRARAQRPQKSAIKEIVKVVGGGVIGLTIGQLILWWLPGNLKRDPLQLGPKIPAFASFLVSPKFRARSLTKQDGATAAQTQTASATGADIGTFGAGFEPSSRSLLDASTDQEQEAIANQDLALGAESNDDGPEQMLDDAGSVDRSSPLAADADAETTTTATSSGQAGIDVSNGDGDSFPTVTEDTASAEATTGDAGESSIPAIPSPFAGPSVPNPFPNASGDAPADSAVAPADFVGVRNAPTITIDLLSTRLAAAVSASIAMDTSSTEPIPKQLTLAKEFYTSLAGLGEAITFVDQASAATQFDEVGKFALEVGKHATKLELIGKVAPSWMKNARPHNGLVAFGTVESIDFSDPYFITSLVMPNSKVLKVVSKIDPSGDYQPQSKVLVLGSILEAPRQNLKNYQGDATRVILDGLHATLPDTE